MTLVLLSQILATSLPFTCYLFVLFAEYVTDSCVCLGGRGAEHGSFEKQLSLPWKTELFKNILPVSSEDINTKCFFG